MKKIEFNRENIEQEGYTLRVEDGITYIEKEEKTNHSKYGECFSFFQQKIELDKEGKEIVTQTDRLYKKIENKEQNLESNELMFEGEDLVLKSMTKYLEKDGSMFYKEVQDFVDKKEKIMFFQKTDQLRVKSIKVSNISNGFCELYTEYDETGQVIREEKLIILKKVDKEISIVTIEQKIKENIEKNIKGSIETIESTYINNKRTYSRWLDEKGDMTAELKINGEVKDWIYYDSNKNIKLTTRIDLINNMEYTNKYKHVNGKSVLIKTMNGKINEEPTFIAEYTSRGVQTYLSYIEGSVKKSIYNDENGKLTEEIEENKESKIEKSTYYKKSGLISVVIEEDKETGIKKRTDYDKSGSISSVTETDKEKGIEKIIDYESGSIKKIIESNKESGIKKTTSYDESGSIRTISVQQFNIYGEWTSILRTIQNSNVPIEEFYKEGESFPTFKVEGFEIPLDTLDKYKDICEKYNIEPLFEVLKAHEPKKDIQSTVKSFIGFFKR